MTVSKPRLPLTITPDFTSENGIEPQGVPTIGAGETRSLTLAFPAAEAGQEGARVRVQSLLVRDAQRALLTAKHTMTIARVSGDTAAHERAKAAYARRATELKQAKLRTLDAFGVALNENNEPYVVEERYPALLQKAQRPVVRPIVQILSRPAAVAA